MSTEQPQYSRTEISDETKRKKTAEEIKATNSGVDKKKTPEGKKELSQTWIQKANLTPAQKQALCDELLVKDIDSEDPKELERRVIALQKHLGFPAKDCDGILGWKTLEKTDKMIEEQHKAGEEETGEKDESETYGLDRVAYEEKKKKEKAEKPSQLKKQLAEGQTENLTDVNGARLEIEDSEDNEKLLKGTGENSDKYYNIDSGTYETKDERTSRIASEKLKDPNSLASIKDGLLKSKSFDDGKKYAEAITAFLDDSDVTEINKSLEGKKWAIEVTNDHGDYREYSLVDNEEVLKTQLADEKSETYKQKMREIFDEMKSKPDQYGETYGGTYDFNEQKLSLEGEDPNQYLTRVVDGKKQMWSSEPEEWEEIKEDDKMRLDPERIAFISSVGGVPLSEGVWESIKGNLYFRSGETLIAALPDGNFQENIKGLWYNKKFDDLPANIQESAANNRLKYFQDTYGDYVDPEFFNGTTAPFRDIPLKQISRVDDWNAGDQKSKIEGGIIINMVNGLLKSKSASAPKMGELTLTEYNQYKKDPASFAKSDRFLGEQRLQKGQRIVTENVGFVDPSLYGVESNGREYARYGKLTISRPSDKTQQGDPANLAITIDGTTKSAYEFVMSSDVPVGMNQMIPGTQIPYSKYPNGDMQLGDKQYIAGVSNPAWTKKVG